MKIILSYSRGTAQLHSEYTQFYFISILLFEWRSSAHSRVHIHRHTFMSNKWITKTDPAKNLQTLSVIRHHYCRSIVTSAIFITIFFFFLYAVVLFSSKFYFFFLIISKMKKLYSFICVCVYKACTYILTNGFHLPLTGIAVSGIKTASCSSYRRT